MNVLIFAPSLIPSVVIGVVKPLIELEKQAQVAIRLRQVNTRVLLGADIQWCDVAVFCRSCELGDLRTAYALKAQGKKIIYEIDDDFSTIPLSTPVAVYHRAYFRLFVVERFFELADCVRVYSASMARWAGEFSNSVKVCRSYFDLSLVEGLCPSQAERQSAEVVKIAYPTGRLDDPELEAMIYGALRQVLENNRGKVTLTLWGERLPKALLGVAGVSLLPLERSYQAFVRAFASAGFDIGVAPLLTEPFFQSKTNNKYREFSGCGLAGVYTNIPPYADCVQQGVNGLLVDNHLSAWVDGIQTLVDQAPLRQGIAEYSLRDVTEHYSFAQAVEQMREALQLASASTPEGSSQLFIAESCRQLCICGADPALVADKTTNDSLLSFFDSLGQLLNLSVVKTAFNSTEAVALVSGSPLSYCLLRSEQDVMALRSMASSVQQAIIDLSTFEDDDSSARALIRTLASKGKVLAVFAANIDQSGLLADGLGVKRVYPPIDLTSGAFYSRSGSPAQLLREVESVYRVSPSLRNAWLAKVLNKIRHGRHRLVSLYLMLKWRLGSRQY